MPDRRRQSPFAAGRAVGALGPDHSQSVERAETAAYALGLAGHRQQAKSLFVRVIKSRERALGGKINFGSAEKLLQANQLGRLYEEVGRFADAESLYQRVVAAQEKAHGPMHAEVARALSKLSLLYAKQERCSSCDLEHNSCEVT